MPVYMEMENIAVEAKTTVLMVTQKRMEKQKFHERV